MDIPSTRRANDAEWPQPDPAFSDETSPDLADLVSSLATEETQSSALMRRLMLHDRAEEARELVHASGAAIALQSDGELVCCAAAGSPAPGLGARVGMEAGLSGLCIRQRAAQFCNDTETDARVDLEGCRRLGVRSIAVLPLFSRSEIIGILELFSDQPAAFSSENMKQLESLADSVAGTATADGTEPASPTSSSAEMTVHQDSSQQSLPPTISLPEEIAQQGLARNVSQWLVLGLMICLLILMSLDWSRHKTHRSTDRVTRSRIEPPIGPSPQHEISKSEAEATPVATRKSSEKKTTPEDETAVPGGLVVIQNGKVIYKEDPGNEARPVKTTANFHTSTTPEKPPLTPAAETQSALSGENGAGGGAASKFLAAPSAITEGRLIHSVEPRYPIEAARERLQGSVTLHGIVGQDGTLHDLVVLQGHPIFAKPALEALEQWRYEPYRKDGQPTDMPVDIVIDFKMPK